MELFRDFSYQRKIEEIARQRDARAGDFDGMVHTGKNLVAKKDVTDTALVRDKIKVRKIVFYCLVLVHFSMRFETVTNCAISELGGAMEGSE